MSVSALSMCYLQLVISTLFLFLQAATATGIADTGTAIERELPRVVDFEIVEKGSPTMYINSTLTSDPSFQTRSQCGSGGADGSGTWCGDHYKCCKIGNNNFYCCRDNLQCCQNGHCCAGVAGSGENCANCEEGRCSGGDGGAGGWSNGGDNCRRNQKCCNYGNHGYYCCRNWEDCCCQGRCCSPSPGQQF